VNLQTVQHLLGLGATGEAGRAHHAFENRNSVSGTLDFRRKHALCYVLILFREGKREACTRARFQGGGSSRSLDTVRKRRADYISQILGILPPRSS
jgi:hypothetical protein